MTDPLLVQTQTDGLQRTAAETVDTPSDEDCGQAALLSHGEEELSGLRAGPG